LFSELGGYRVSAGTALLKVDETLLHVNRPVPPPTTQPTLEEIPVESPKIFLPMMGRKYAVTLTEQRDLARRYGVSEQAVRSALFGLQARLLDGSEELLKSATKVKKLIAHHFESSDAKGRQSALANGPMSGPHSLTDGALIDPRRRSVS
jgi:hypothetical protein